MRYIQRRDRQFGQLETVDEFPTSREARAMLREYMLADPSGVYYISARACRDWREASREAVAATDAQGAR